MMTEIDKMLQGSELRELADFIANPENEITDCIICYQTPSRYGYKYLSTSSTATLRGLLAFTDDQIYREVIESMECDDELD